MASAGIYVYGNNPDIDGLFREQAAELDHSRRAATLENIQRLMHDKVMSTPIRQLAFLNGVGRRIQESGLRTQREGGHPVNKRQIAIVIAATWAVVVMVAGAAFAQTGEQFVLSGLVYMEGGRGVAWLQEPSYTGDRVVVVKVGDTIGPYRLTKILDDQVELEGPGGKVAVPLAGTGGAISVASIPRTPGPGHQPQGEVVMGAHPAHNDPRAIVLERGDPRRNFPASDLLIGAGAIITGKTGPTVAPAPQARAVDRGIVPPELQTGPPPGQVGPTAYQNPEAVIIQRGDPRRNFPASKLLIGAGAQVGGTPAQTQP